MTKEQYGYIQDVLENIYLIAKGDFDSLDDEMDMNEENEVEVLMDIIGSVLDQLDVCHKASKHKDLDLIDLGMKANINNRLGMNLSTFTMDHESLLKQFITEFGGKTLACLTIKNLGYSECKDEKNEQFLIYQSRSIVYQGNAYCCLNFLKDLLSE